MRLLRILLCCCAFLAAGFSAMAQMPATPGVPVTLQNAPQRDTTNRASKGDWRDEPVQIHATRAFSNIPLYPDTAIHNFQRRPFLQPWYRDLGNLGTPARSQYFIPENLGRTGPSLGYHVFDVYRFHTDSLLYYTTTRPYTVFNYQLGSKLEQTLRVLHTQNISPRWNFAVQYQKIASPGYYRLQRTYHDAGGLSTHFTSRNQQYQLFGAIVYNKEQSDENGGILGDSLLWTSTYSDLQTIPVALDNAAFSQTSSAGRRSAITNTLRDFNVALRHQYTWGRKDTIYNSDSTQYGIALVPRFSIGHRFEAGSEKHKFKDIAPDSSVYTSFFKRGFASADSVYSEQQWAWLDNEFSLNGFLGTTSKQVQFSAGIGSRVDNFYTAYIRGKESNSIISTYLNGELKKEALSNSAWGYEADAKLFLAGDAAGNFLLRGNISKKFGAIGLVRVGGIQQLNQAPYAYSIYANQYFRQEASLNKENITTVFAEVNNQSLGLNAGIRNYIISNYIYLTDSLGRVTNGKLELSQYAGTFSITQINLRKVFRFGFFVLDNDLAVQQVAGGAPVSVPLLLGRHAASYESYLFNHALKVATGIEGRYHTSYRAEGYAPFYNRFYYQSDSTSSNKPEFNIFFNFKVKRFRAYLMADQVQTLFYRNTIITPHYPSQDLMIRFGFEWVMVN